MKIGKTHLFSSLFFAATQLTALSNAVADVPAQFLGKLYTEALGRAPDSGGWSAYTNWFSTIPEGCNERTLRHIAYMFYTSPEFISNYNDNAARLLALYRGVLNREPDQSGFASHYNQLSNGISWETVVLNFLDLSPGSEFQLLVDTLQICKSGPYFFWSRVIDKDNTRSRPIDIRAAAGRITLFPNTVTTNTAKTRYFEPTILPPAGGYSIEDLQAQVDAFHNAGGGTFFLPQMALFIADRALTIPSKVILKTHTNTGTLTPASYALMARIVRGSNYRGSTEPLGTAKDPSAPIVIVEGDLEGVWVDGLRGYHSLASSEIDPHSKVRISPRDIQGQHEPNVLVRNNASPTLQFNRISDSTGSAHVSIGVSYGCSLNNAVKVNNNLITDYAGKHAPGTTDGIIVHCPNSEVKENEIIDITDVGVVLFRVTPEQKDIETSFPQCAAPNILSCSKEQHSKVTGNRIIQVGNSAWAGIALDAMFPDPPTVPTSFSFDGSEVSGNTLWTDTSGLAHIDAWPLSLQGEERVSPHFSIVLAVGTKAWWGSKTNNVSGVTVTNNGSGGLSTNRTIGLSVNGTSDFNQIDGNYLPGTSSGFIDNGCGGFAIGTTVGPEVTAIKRENIQGGSYESTDVIREGGFGCLLWPSYK